MNEWMNECDSITQHSRFKMTNKITLGLLTRDDHRSCAPALGTESLGRFPVNMVKGCQTKTTVVVTSILGQKFKSIPQLDVSILMLLKIRLNLEARLTGVHSRSSSISKTSRNLFWKKVTKKVLEFEQTIYYISTISSCLYILGVKLNKEDWSLCLHFPQPSQPIDGLVNVHIAVQHCEVKYKMFKILEQTPNGYEICFFGKNVNRYRKNWGEGVLD